MSSLRIMADVNCEHVGITRTSHILSNLRLVASGESLRITYSESVGRLLVTSTRAYLLCCTLVGATLFFHFATLADAQYTGDFQTNTIGGVVSNWTGNYIVGSNTFADALLIENGGVLSNGFGQLGCQLSSNNSVHVVNRGVWRNERLYVGDDRASGNSLVVSGGTVLATGLTVGLGSGSCDNSVELDSGSMIVTNATADAVLEVRSGKLILNGGVLQADRLVMTNASGQFVRNGGTLIVGSLVLDPNLDANGDGMPNGWEQAYGLDPLGAVDIHADHDNDGLTDLQEFQAGTDPTDSDSALKILGIKEQGCDVLVTWEAGGGRTNVLQAARSPWGAYFNISSNIVITSVGDIATNVCDTGAATNTNSRYYRVATRSTSVTGTMAPSLAVTSPANNSYTTNSTVSVAGTSASAAGVAGVDVNGFAASSTNGYGNWVATVSGLTAGTNTLSVLAGDNVAPANIATNSTRVIYAVGDFDGNGDGLPDAWQIRYFGSVYALNARPSVDADGDGLSNFEEYQLGTNPQNPDSDGDGISDGPLAPSGSGLQTGPDPDLVMVSGSVCYPFTGVAAVTIGMLNMNVGLALCPFVRVSLNPTMSPSTLFNMSGGPATYTLAEDYNQPTNDIYVQFADLNTNVLGQVIHRTIPFFFEPDSARNVATCGIDTNLAIAALDTNSDWWARNVAIYTTMDDASTNYVRNPNCWAQGFDLTCIAAYNSYEGNARCGGTLISPRHVVFANHYYPPNGTEMRFVANDNTVVTRVLSNSVQINLTDLRIGVLDSDVPTNLVTFAKVLPSSFTNYFPNSLKPMSSKYIPALCLNQNADALESDISGVTAGVTFQAPTDPTRSEFYEDKTSGDSGQPGFIILNGQLVLLTVYTYGGAGSGWFIPGYLDQINAAMAALGGGYSVTTVDLSPFTSCNGDSVPSP